VRERQRTPKDSEAINVASQFEGSTSSECCGPACMSLVAISPDVLAHPGGTKEEHPGGEIVKLPTGIRDIE